MITVLAAIALVGLSAAQSGYTGEWYRDDVRSDDPKPKIEATVAGFIQKMSRGRATEADADPQFVKRLRDVLDTFVQYADELYVERGSRELVVDDGGDDLRIYYLDGEKHERQMADGTRLETTAMSTHGKIEVEMKTSNGAKIFETYALSSDAEELVLTVRLEDKQLKEPLVIRNVYTRVE
jgi:hypothetical protein